jgi:hypothetical protein
MTASSFTVVEAEPDLTVIVPCSIRNEPAYRLPSAFKVTIPSDNGDSIAALPKSGHRARRRSAIFAFESVLARDLHTKRRISPYRLHVGHGGTGLLLLPQLASDTCKRFSQISFNASRVLEGRVKDGFHISSHSTCWSPPAKYGVASAKDDQ